MPHSGKLFGFRLGLCHVQQRLRRDTASQEADSAQPSFEIDQCDLQTKIGGKESSRKSLAPVPRTQSWAFMGITRD